MYVHVQYDGVLLLQAVGKLKHRIQGHGIKSLPQSTTRFRQIQIGPLILLDSMALMPSSLSKLGEALLLSNHPFPILNQLYPGEVNAAKRKALSGKGEYPYNLITGLEVLKEPREEPPPRESFYNTIQERELSEKDYERVKWAWKVFKCKTLQDYTIAYLEGKYTVE